MEEQKKKISLAKKKKIEEEKEDLKRRKTPKFNLYIKLSGFFFFKKNILFYPYFGMVNIVQQTTFTKLACF